MPEYLKPGTKIKMESGDIAVIESFLGNGSLAQVYKVSYNGHSKALKMYIPERLGEKNLNWFHENLTEEIHNGRPSDKFIWPEDLTEWQDGTFGYIMDLRPADYMEFGDLLLGKKEISSFTAMINCALRMVSVFWVLHNKGLCFYDLSDSNFLIRVKDGDLLINAHKNVAPVGNSSRLVLQPKPRYVAPSVVMGGKPNYNTDRFSLATCLFLLLVRTHPLEGVRTLNVPEMNYHYLQLCYGKDPIFIADPTDRSNGPSKEIEGVRNYFKRWPLLTKSVQNTFIRAFSKEAMLHNESKFPLGKDWQRVLLQYRSWFVKCPVCGKETLYQGEPVCKCCHEKYPVYGYLRISNHGKYNIPIVKDGGIFQEHVDDFDVDNTLQFEPKRISRVRVKSAANLVALVNFSESKWVYHYADGTSGSVNKDEYVQLKNKMEIKINGVKITVSM